MANQFKHNKVWVTMDDLGFLYVLANSAMPGLVKVAGETQMQNGSRSSRFQLSIGPVSSAFLVHAPTCHCTHQTQAAQQHGVGFGFGDRGYDNVVNDGG